MSDPKEWKSNNHGLTEQRLDERYAHLAPETREHMKRKHRSLFDWVREDFDPWSELTRERDGYREDQEREQRERDDW